jgi:hypothetical protein
VNYNNLDDKLLIKRHFATVDAKARVILPFSEKMKIEAYGT